MRIVADAGGSVHIQLRDGEVASERRGEIIVDLNHDGRWIRGFEVIGGMMDFSLSAATKPFLSSKPGGCRVTYDEDAAAAYFYIQYGPRFMELRRDEQQSAETYSHSVNPTGLYRFDAQGGLLGVATQPSLKINPYKWHKKAVGCRLLLKLVAARQPQMPSRDPSGSGGLLTRTAPLAGFAQHPG